MNILECIAKAKADKVKSQTSPINIFAFFLQNFLNWNH